MELIRTIAKLRPALMSWGVNYLKVWLHLPAYNGEQGEVGEGAVIRFLGHKSKMHCCFLSEVLITVSNKLNLTLEYVDYQDAAVQSFETTRQGHLTLDKADVYGGSVLMWPAMFEGEWPVDTTQVTFSQPLWETHEVTAIVPKHKTQKNCLNLFSVLSLKIWLLFFCCFTTYVVFDAFHTANFTLKAFGLITKSLFKIFKLTLGEDTSKKTILVLFWKMCVSLLFVQMLLTQLLSILTTERIEWPDTFQKLYENRERYRFFGNIHYYMYLTGKPEILVLKDLTQGSSSDPLNLLRGILQQNHVYFMGAVESDAVADLLNPHRYAILDEKYLLSPYIFYVSQKFAYKKQFIELSQKMFEGGFERLVSRPQDVFPLILRLTHPDLTNQLFFYEAITPIAIDDTKGIFVLLALNSIVAVLIAIYQVIKKSRTFRKVSEYSLAKKHKVVTKPNK